MHVAGDDQRTDADFQQFPDYLQYVHTGRDLATANTQVFLLDASDLADTQGIERELLSPTGAHDLTNP